MDNELSDTAKEKLLTIANTSDLSEAIRKLEVKRSLQEEDIRDHAHDLLRIDFLMLDTFFQGRDGGQVAWAATRARAVCRPGSAQAAFFYVLVDRFVPGVDDGRDRDAGGDVHPALIRVLTYDHRIIRRGRVDGDTRL